MTAGQRRAIEAASVREQRAAKAATAALDDKDRMDWLTDAGVAYIHLSDGRCIDVRRACQTLRDVIDSERFPIRSRVALPAAAVEAGRALDAASIEHGDAA